MAVAERMQPRTVRRVNGAVGQEERVVLLRLVRRAVARSMAAVVVEVVGVVRQEMFAEPPLLGVARIL